MPTCVGSTGFQPVNNNLPFYIFPFIIPYRTIFFKYYLKIYNYMMYLS